MHAIYACNLCVNYVICLALSDPWMSSQCMPTLGVVGDVWNPRTKGSRHLFDPCFGACQRADITLKLQASDLLSKCCSSWNGGNLSLTKRPKVDDFNLSHGKAAIVNAISCTRATVTMCVLLASSAMHCLLFNCPMHHDDSCQLCAVDADLQLAL